MPDVFMYRNDQPGAPVLSDALGSLNALLNACLVTGFGSTSLVSITRTGSVATGSTSSAHTFAVGDPVLVAGATQPEYNGTFTVTAVAGNTLSWAVAGTPTTPATGTFTVKIAPAGWERPYTSGNVSVFRSANVASSRRYFRINDGQATHASGYKWAECRLYESMTAVSTGTLRVTRNWYKVYPGHTAKWVLVASGRTVYLFNTSHDGYPNDLLPYAAFGDINSHKAGDTYHAFVLGSLDSIGNLVDPGVLASAGAAAVCRAYTGVGSAVDLHGACSAVAHFSVPGGLNPVDGTVPLVFPRLATESHTTYQQVLRGTVPGIGTALTPYANQIAVEAAKPSGFWARLDGVSIGGTTRDALILGVTQPTVGAIAVDLTGPWH